MYADALRERVEIQYQAIADDGAGGWTGSGTWTTVRRIPCSIAPMSSREKLTYKRQGHEAVLVIMAEDPIPRTTTASGSGWTSLFDFLNDSGGDRLRLLYLGRRTLTIIGYDRAENDPGDPFSDMVKIIVVETPRKVGAVDA